MTVGNSRFKNALAREEQNVPPIWFMRQAGRYHKHYQALRSQHSFMQLCKDPELASEVALGPIQDFDFDVAILFSDLLFPLEAMGMGLVYDPGPKLAPLLTEKALSELRPVGEAWHAVEFQKQAMQKTRAKLPNDKSLIGFVGGAWTLFTYAVEGAHKGGLEKSKMNLSWFKPFCERLLPLLEKNIQLQLEGGAEAVMIFDTSAGEVSPQLYREAIVPTVRWLAERFPKKLGYYAKGIQAPHLADPLFLKTDSPLAGLGFDHRWNLAECLNDYSLGFVQGNFDQSLLFMAKAQFAEQLQKYLHGLREAGPQGRRGWVSGLGHGVLPETPEENVRAMVKIIREELA